ncbi:IclR family transcriptional regulator [Clostridia bacterium]|nr:IclR family transcriptional regulator [Clostridia bacterium]
MKEEAKYKSLAKALSVLELFQAKTPELGVTEICRMLGLNKSNVHSIVSTFEYMGYLEQNPKTEKYHLGTKILEYTYVLNDHLGYQRTVYPALRNLAEASGMTAYFAIPKNNRVLYMCNAYPPSVQEENYAYRSIIGETAPMTCTSLGKAMLAFSDDEHVDKSLFIPRERFTDHTLLDEQDIRDELKAIHAAGISHDLCEHEFSVRCMGIPVFRRDGTLVGAISISGMEQSFTAEHIDRCERLLRDVAFRLRNRF